MGAAPRVGVALRRCLPSCAALRPAADPLPPLVLPPCRQQATALQADKDELELKLAVAKSDRAAAVANLQGEVASLQSRLSRANKAAKEAQEQARAAEACLAEAASAAGASRDEETGLRQRLQAAEALAQQQAQQLEALRSEAAQAEQVGAAWVVLPGWLRARPSCHSSAGPLCFQRTPCRAAAAPPMPQRHQEELARERQAHAEEAALLRQERDVALEVGAHRCLAGQMGQQQRSL